MLFWPGLSHGRRKRVHIHGVWVAARAAPDRTTGEEASKSSWSTNVEPFHIFVLHICQLSTFSHFTHLFTYFVHQMSPFFIIFIICFSKISVRFQRCTDALTWRGRAAGVPSAYPSYGSSGYGGYSYGYGVRGGYSKESIESGGDFGDAETHWQALKGIDEGIDR